MRGEVYSKSKWREMKKKGKKSFLKRNLIMYWIIGVLVIGLFNEIIINASNMQVTSIQRIIMQLIVPLAFFGIIAVATTEKVWMINEDVRKNGFNQETMKKIKVLTFVEYICMLIPFVVFNINSFTDNFAICMIKVVMLAIMTILYTVIFTKITSKSVIEDLEAVEKRKYK